MVVLRLLHATHLRLVGLALAALVALRLHAARSEGSLAVDDLRLLVPAALALLLLLPWPEPRGLRHPSRPRDLAWLAVPALAAASYAWIVDADAAAPFAPRLAVAALQALTNPLWWLLPAVVLTAARVFTQRDAPAPPPRPAPPREAALPALGAAMKLYVVADWAMLRGVGVGLMATAWFLWTLLERGRVAEAAALAHGQDPLHAMLLYAGAGAMLALPFLLPRCVARPRHVVFGLLKAALLVGAAAATLPSLTLAIVEFTPEMYHATLLQTVPRLFKAVCGVAVTAALLLSFFRQLGRLPALDPDGPAGAKLTPGELAALRKSRMPA